MATSEERATGADVLIAADDAEARAALRLLLEGHGFRCAEALDGQQALSLARSAPPRCLLLDLRLPGLDGFAVARQLRADPRTRGIHIHCLTGLVAAQAREEACRAGCEQFLTKPVDPGKVLEAVWGPGAASQPGWVSGLTLAEARDLLDWLENHGCTGLEIAIEEGTGFGVRCACPPGFRLARDDSGKVRLVPE
jgi:CheY-like chemotaxis protein